MGKEKKSDFTKAFPPADPKDLPKEQRELLERQKRMEENKPQEGEELQSLHDKQDQDLINATAEANALSPNLLAPGGAEGMQFFAEKAAESMAYYASRTSYVIEMMDGSVLRVYRVPAPKYALEAMKNLDAEIRSSRNFNDPNITLNPMEVRKKEIELDEMKWATYIRYHDTNEPVMRADILNAKNSTVVDVMVEACLAISVSKWTEAKK